MTTSILCKPFDTPKQGLAFAVGLGLLSVALRSRSHTPMMRINAQVHLGNEYFVSLPKLKTADIICTVVSANV